MTLADQREQNFTIRQGETWTAGITVQENTGTEAEPVYAPINITGATITGAVRERPGTAVVATIACTIVDGAAGTVHLEMTDETTAAIPAATSYQKSKTYHYDVLMKSSGGDPGVYLLYGEITLWGGVQIA